MFVAFGDTSLAELQAAAAGQHPHGAPAGGSGPAADPALTPRLRATLLRLAGDSIGKYRQLFAAQPGSKLARALDPPHPAGSSILPGSTAAGVGGPKPAPAPAGGSGSANSAMGSAAQYFRRTLPGGSTSSSTAAAAGAGPTGAAGSMPSGNGTPAAPGAGPSAAAAAAVAAASLAPAAESSVVSNAGNLWGLLERTTAAESLLAVALQLQRARSALAAALPPAEAPTLDAFLSRTVGAAEDLRDLVVRAGGERTITGTSAGSLLWQGRPPTGRRD